MLPLQLQLQQWQQHQLQLLVEKELVLQARAHKLCVRRHPDVGADARLWQSADLSVTSALRKLLFNDGHECSC